MIECVCLYVVSSRVASKAHEFNHEGQAPVLASPFNIALLAALLLTIYKHIQSITGIVIPWWVEPRRHTVVVLCVCVCVYVSPACFSATAKR